MYCAASKKELANFYDQEVREEAEDYWSRPKMKARMPLAIWFRPSGFSPMPMPCR